jgi:hypothetical protein
VHRRQVQKITLDLCNLQSPNKPRTKLRIAVQSARQEQFLMFTCASKVGAADYSVQDFSVFSGSLIGT